MIGRLIAALASVVFLIGAVSSPTAFDLPDPAVGLDSLGNYRATLTLTFDGTRDGQPEQWSRIDTLAVSRDPAARVYTSDQSGSTVRQLVRVAIGATLYETVDAGACTAIAAAEDIPPFGTTPGEPAALLSGLLGAEEVGTETIGAVPTTHYTFDERSFGSPILRRPSATSGWPLRADSRPLPTRHRGLDRLPRRRCRRSLHLGLPAGID